MKEFYVAGGCFWKVQQVFSRQKGVIFTETGYINSEEPDPTYERVCTGVTRAVEAVRIIFDEDEVSAEDLFRIFWEMIDPTSYNMQGTDIGSQYRTGLYAQDEALLSLMEQSRDREQLKFEQKILTEIMVPRNYYRAEEYHQHYLT